MTESADESTRRGAPNAWRLAIALLLTLAAVRAALPWGLEALIESRTTESLGRLVRIGDVDVELLAGALHLEGVAIGPIFEGTPPETLDPEAAHFRCDLVAVRWSWLALLAREIRIEVLELDSPEIFVVRAEDGHLVPVLRPSGDGSPPPDDATPEGEPTDPGEAWPIHLDRLQIAGLEAYFVNLARPERRPVELEFEALTLQDLALRGDEIALGSVALRGPRLRVIRDIDLTPFVAPESSEEAVAEDDAATELALEPPADAPRPRPYRLAEVDIERADFTLVTDDGSEIVVALELHARNVSSQLNALFPLELSIGLEEGSIELEGELGLSPIAFQGSVVWSDLPLHPVDEATGSALPFRVASGVTSGNLKLDALVSNDADRDPTRIDISGHLDVRALDLSSEADGFALTWSSLEVEAEAIALRPDTPTPTRIELARVRIESPTFAATLADDTREPSEDPAAARDPASDPALRLASFDLVDGRLALLDERLDPSLRTELREVEVHARDVRWPEREVGSLEARGRGPGNSQLSTRGAVREGKGSIQVDLEQLGLAALSPYAENAAGYRLEAGEATLNATASLDGERVDVESELKLDQLDVAELSDGGFQKDFGVPLDLALALLRDPKGRIALPVDVAIERGESAVGLRKVVLGALRQALVGAVSSPIKGLQLVMPEVGGREPARLDVLAAEPGDISLADTSQLDRLAQAMASRPGLRVLLRGQAGPADDPAIAERIVTEAVVGDGQLPPVSAPRRQRKRVRAAVEARSHGETAPLDPEDEALLERWVAAVEVPASRREALGAARAESLRDALLARGLGAERVELASPREGEPGVAIELALVGD